MGTPKIGACWDPAPQNDGACLTQRKDTPPHTDYHVHFDRSWSNSLECTCGIRQALHVPPFKVTQDHRTDRHASIGYLRLPVNVPQQSQAYLVPFLRYSAIQVNNCEFSPPKDPRRMDSPWNWATPDWLKNQNDGLLEKKKSDYIISRLDTIHECDRQTDRQTPADDGQYRAYAQRRVTSNDYQAHISLQINNSVGFSIELIKVEFPPIFTEVMTSCTNRNGGLLRSLSVKTDLRISCPSMSCVFFKIAESII